MPERRLPEDGELRLSGVMLSGERAYTEEGGNQPVAWVSDGRVPDAGRIWLDLSDLAAQTGLRPVLSDRGAESFVYHADVAALAELDAGEILAERWDDKTVPDGDPDADVWVARRHQPFTRQFPGLAATVREQLPVSAVEEALDTVPPQFVCLAAVSRPADFLTEVGWLITEAWDPPPALSAVLRSWEDRFGARLLQIGPGAEIRLLVSRPPRIQDAALAVAAELWAFGDTVWVTHSSLDQVYNVADVASLIIGQPIWGFWWADVPSRGRRAVPAVPEGWTGGSRLATGQREVVRGSFPGEYVCAAYRGDHVGGCIRRGVTGMAYQYDDRGFPALWEGLRTRPVSKVPVNPARGPWGQPGHVRGVLTISRNTPIDWRDSLYSERSWPRFLARLDEYPFGAMMTVNALDDRGLPVDGERLMCAWHVTPLPRHGWSSRSGHPRWVRGGLSPRRCRTSGRSS